MFPPLESAMRVLLLNQAFYPDHAATAQHAHDLARELVQCGHEVHVVASRAIYGQRGARLPRREVVHGITVHRVGGSIFGKGSIFTRLLDFAFFYVLATVKVLRLPRPDVIVPFTTPPFIALAGYLLRLVKRSRYIYWVMDLYPDLPVACGMMKPTGLARRFLERLHRFCLRRADRVVVLGRCMRDRVLAKGVPAESVQVIGVWADHREIRPVNTDENIYRQQWGLEKSFVVMYSGNLGLGHDVNTLCDAMLRLRERDDIQFVFVGGGKRMEQVQAFTAKHGLTHVQVHDYQPREQLAQSLSLADVHLITLLDPVNGIMVPSKLFGIMAAARPAIFVGPDSSEIARVLAESQAGLVTRCNDGEGLAHLIAQLADAPDTARAMGARARTALIERYDRQHACKAWEQLLRECVHPAAPAHDAQSIEKATG